MGKTHSPPLLQTPEESSFDGGMCTLNQPSWLQPDYVNPFSMYSGQGSLGNSTMSTMLEGGEHGGEHGGE